MSEAARIHGVSPILLVADVARAADYYASALGFRAQRMWGEPPHFCIPERDGLQIMLNQVGPGDTIQPNADHDGRFDAYFTVTGIDALCAELKENGADIVCEPEDQPFGMREFQVRDPDGHLLAFGQIIEGAA